MHRGAGTCSIFKGAFQVSECRLIRSKPSGEILTPPSLLEATHFKALLQLVLFPMAELRLRGVNMGTEIPCQPLSLVDQLCTSTLTRNRLICA